MNPTALFYFRMAAFFVALVFIIVGYANYLRKGKVPAYYVSHLIGCALLIATLLSLFLGNPRVLFYLSALVELVGIIFLIFANVNNRQGKVRAYNFNFYIGCALIIASSVTAIFPK